MSSIPLSDVCDYSEATTSVGELTLCNFISTDNMMPNRGGIIDAVNLPPANSCCKFKEDEILISNIRPYFKKIWYATFEGGCSNDVLILHCKNKKFHPKFVYYCLFQDLFFKHQMAGSKGSKMPRGDQDQIMTFQIPEFEKPDQEEIADYLTLLDKKIELNSRINTELEVMAKTIYNYWFVQFDFPNEEGQPYKTSGGEMKLDKNLKKEIPERWETNKLSHLYDFQYGFGNNNPSNGGQYPVYGSNGVIGGFDRYNNEDAPVIGHIGANCGSLVYASGKHYVTYNGVMCKIKNGFNKYFAFVTLKSKNLRSITRGSSQPFISYDLLNNIDFVIPSDDILKKFIDLINPAYDKIISLKKENQRLAELRDWLLPLLMNGQVKMS